MMPTSGKTSCSTKKLERDDDSKKKSSALAEEPNAEFLVLAPPYFAATADLSIPRKR
jgi:hypothetical protein